MNPLIYQVNLIRDQPNWAQSPITGNIDMNMDILTLIPLILILNRIRLKKAYSLLTDHVLALDLKPMKALNKLVVSQESKGSPVMITMMQ